MPDAAALRRRRAAAQSLHRPAGATAESVVRGLLAVQAQDPRAARLALRARARGLTAADVDAARADGLLVRSWLLRGTLHLVHRDDFWWLHALTAPRQAAMSARRLGQEGVTPEEAGEAVGIVAAALAAEGPLTRAELGARLAQRGIPTAGQALPHLLFRAALDGVAVLGPDRDGEPAFVAAHAWLGPPPPFACDAALAELARRYLAGHGPAGEADLASWAGLPRRDARAGLSALDAAEATVPDGGLVDLRGRAAPPRTGARLLGAFDPYLLGWRDRGFALAAEHAARVHPGGGILRPTVVHDGAVTGTWRAERRGGRLRIAVEPFPGTEAGVPDAEVADVARFEGLEPGWL